MKTNKSIYTLIREVIKNNYKVNKKSKKLQENIENTKISPKLQFWISKLAQIVADEVYFKDIKITNTKWEDIFDLYDKGFSPQKAAAVIIKLDENLSNIKTKFPHLMESESTEKPVDILSTIKTISYNDTEFTDILDTINSLRATAKIKAEKRRDGSYGFVDPTQENNSDESIRIPQMLLTPKASRIFYKDPENFKPNSKDVLIDYNVFNSKVDADDKMSKLSLSRKNSVPYIHKDTINKIKVFDEDGTELNGTIVDSSKVPYNLEKLRSIIMKKPAELLSWNEKSKHSTGGFETVYNLGLPALTGLCVDEKAEGKPFIIVNTCPRAGSCKKDCFAMKGGYVQWEGSSVKMARKLNYLINHFNEFKNQLIREIEKQYKDALELAKQDAKELGVPVEQVPWHLLIRFHDSGDFFSDDYIQLAQDVAKEFSTGEYEKNPVLFYAYTKESKAMNILDKLGNFTINFSLGSRDKVDVKTTKLAAIVDKLPLNKTTPDLRNTIIKFLSDNPKTQKYDIVSYMKNIAKLPNKDRKHKITTLLNRIKTKDAQALKRLFEKEVLRVDNTAWKEYVKRVQTGNKVKVKVKVDGDVVKDEFGKIVYKEVDEYKWEFISDRAWNLFRDRLVKEYGDKYGITYDSILKYSDWVKIPRQASSGEENVRKWNVVILPGIDGDLAASRKDVHISFLLKH